MKKIINCGLLAATAAAILLTGCGSGEKAAAPAKAAKLDLSQTKDGTYTADSSSDAHLGKGRMTIVIKNHKIIGASGIGIDPDSKEKDRTYGMTDGQVKEEAKYKKAQIAVKAINSYSAQLVETQDPEKVDMVAGATISYNQFKEAAYAAIAKAKK